MDEGFGVAILSLIISLLVMASVISNVEERQTIENLKILSNSQIIETHVNVNRYGENEYYIIVENTSGDLIEINVDLNTYVNYGGEL